MTRKNQMRFEQNKRAEVRADQASRANLEGGRATRTASASPPPCGRALQTKSMPRQEKRVGGASLMRQSARNSRGEAGQERNAGGR